SRGEHTPNARPTPPPGATGDYPRGYKHGKDVVTMDATRTDPTKMMNQPALQTSSGRIWLVMGGLFMVVSLIPLGALAFIRQGPSAPLAMVVGVGVIGLYAAMVGAR